MQKSKFYYFVVLRSQADKSRFFSLRLSEDEFSIFPLHMFLENDFSVTFSKITLDVDVDK